MSPSTGLSKTTALYSVHTSTICLATHLPRRYMLLYATLLVIPRLPPSRWLVKLTANVLPYPCRVDPNRYIKHLPSTSSPRLSVAHALVWIIRDHGSIRSVSFSNVEVILIRLMGRRPQMWINVVASSYLRHHRHVWWIRFSRLMSHVRTCWKCGRQRTRFVCSHAIKPTTFLSLSQRIDHSGW